MKTRTMILIGIITAVAIVGASYATSFDNADADDVHKGIGKTEIWEPGPTDGFTPTEIPAHQYQEAQERPSYTEALSSGSIMLASESPKLSDKQLDNVMDELLHSELDRFILPIASIAIDYDRDILVLWTPDLTIGNKVKAIVGDVPFVLLYEEAPPRWEHDGPSPESESEPISEFGYSVSDFEKIDGTMSWAKMPTYIPQEYSLKDIRLADNGGLGSMLNLIYGKDDLSVSDSDTIDEIRKKGMVVTYTQGEKLDNFDWNLFVTDHVNENPETRTFSEKNGQLMLIEKPNMKKPWPSQARVKIGYNDVFVMSLDLGTNELEKILWSIVENEN